MKLVDTLHEKNKSIEDPNQRTCLIEIDCHEMRQVIDGLLKKIQGYENITEPDQDDVAKLKWLKEEFEPLWKDAYRRTKNLMGVNIEP